MKEPPRQDAGRLRRLEALARLKAEAELARLAVAARSRARLSAALAALGESEPPLGPVPPAGAGHAPLPGTGGRAQTEPGLDRADPSSGTNAPGLAAPQSHQSAEPAWIDPHLVRVRLAHGGWISAQRREINARLAMVQADWLRLQPQAARALGRAEVLDRLATAAARRRPPASDG